MGLGQFFNKRRRGAFGRSRSGNVAMMWALLGAGILGLTGLSVDFTRAQSIRAQLQNAADGAVLAASRAQGMTLEQRQAAAQAYFQTAAGEYASVTGRSMSAPKPSAGA